MEPMGKESALWLKILYGIDKNKMIIPKSKSIYSKKIDNKLTQIKSRLVNN